MGTPVIQTSFASGEWSPKLRARVDIAKYRAGAALLRNWYVDYSGGGASTRPGTRYLAQVAANGARLIPFQASTTVSYVLEFGANYIRFYSAGAQIVTAPNTPYQISSPYAAADLFPNQATGNPGLKFVQDANALIICHPSYAPAILTLVSATNWTYTAINFGSSIATPTGVAATSNLAAGSYNYAYLVTAVDTNGQESGPSTPATLASLTNLASTNGTNTITWSATPGAVSYNVYKAYPNSAGVVPSGVGYGFIGNVTGLTFVDTNPGVAPDFAQTPPILQNPFSGASVQSLTLTGNANYTTVPTVTIAAPASGIQATAYVSLTVSAVAVAAGGTAYKVGDTITLAVGGQVILTVSTISGLGVVTGVTITQGGSVTSGSVHSNPVSQLSSSGAGTGATFNLTWNVGALILVSGGSGYTSTPAVTFSAGAATATATLGAASAGNPAVPGFFQERLMLAAQVKAVQGYQLSQPASFFNFNTSDPAQSDDAITGTIISEELNDIRSLIPVPAGIIAITGRGAWVISGGGGLSTLNPITPVNQVASPQAFNGGNDLKPVKINFDVIYGTNKGSYFRDLTYNVYANIFTGADITTLSNHLFFNHYFLDIAWAEEPFKTMWIVREDGILLSLAFVKEQELIGWAHHDTNGQFKSVCSVIETVGNGNVVDAVYVIVERTINGAVVQYVERMADRYFPYGAEDSWSVDCGLQTATAADSVTSQSVANITGQNVLNGSVTINFTNNTGFNNSNIGSFFRIAGGVFKVTAVNSGTQVVCTITRAATLFNPYTNNFYANQQWTFWATVSSVSGLTQLIGQQVVGVADGVAIGPLTVSGGGSVTLPSPASKVTLGLAFTPQLRTLSLDVGEPTIQGKRKKISKILLRVADTLGLQIGTTFSTLVTMKDFQLGAIPSTSTGPSAKVIDLVNPSWNPDAPVIDGLQLADGLWQENGQFCIQQNLPYPATICGVIPEVTPGDTNK